MTTIERLPSEKNDRQNTLSRFVDNAGLGSDLVKYGLASALALALDFAVLMISNQLLGFNHLAAAAAGFLSGLALIYLLSVRVVFRDRRGVSAGAEVAGFLLSGLAGLALTEALMHLFVDRLGIAPPLSKIPTSALVFLFNFIARRRLLFSRGRTA
jgi:putative flippase GtrA